MLKKPIEFKKLRVLCEFHAFCYFQVFVAIYILINNTRVLLCCVSETDLAKMTCGVIKQEITSEIFSNPFLPSVPAFAWLAGGMSVMTKTQMVSPAQLQLPVKKLLFQNPYDQFKEVKAAQGVKVLAKEMDKALAGTSLLVARHDDEIQILKVQTRPRVNIFMSICFP